MVNQVDPIGRTTLEPSAWDSQQFLSAAKVSMAISAVIIMAARHCGVLIMKGAQHQGDAVWRIDRPW